MNKPEAWAIESAGENAIETYDHLLKNCPLGDADKKRVLKAKAAAEWIEQSGTLIAAAPEMLEALRTVIEVWDNIPITHKHSGMVGAINKARNAIQKVEGEK